MRIKNEPILAIDPGLRELGFAILTGNDLLESGVLQLRHLAEAERLGCVRRHLDRLIESFGPRSIVVEQIPKSPLDGNLPRLGRLLGRLGRRYGLKAFSYSAKTARRSVVGDGWAGKADVVRRLAAQFPQLRVYRGQSRKWKDTFWQNMFDAIALALHHQQATAPPSRSR